MLGPLKCENNSALNVKKRFSHLDDQSDGQLGQFCRPGQFLFGILGLRGVNIFQKLKIRGSVMIFTENVKFRSGSG